MAIKSSENQQSRAFWQLDFIRAYDDRKKMKTEENCKMSQSLRAVLQGAFSGGTIAKCGKGATHIIGKGYELLDGMPEEFIPQLHLKIPTMQGMVYVKRVKQAVSFSLILDRAFCKVCQQGV